MQNFVYLQTDNLNIIFFRLLNNIQLNKLINRLFRVYAHIFHQHFDHVLSLDEEAHLNTSFKHFVYFITEFSLIDKRELAPMQHLIDKLLANDRARYGK